jgi:hypothetical protein
MSEYTETKTIIEKTTALGGAQDVTLAVAATLANDGDCVTVSVYAIGRDQAYPGEELIRDARVTCYRYSGTVNLQALYSDTSGFNNAMAVTGLNLIANGDDVELVGTVNAASTVDWVAHVRTERFT